MENNKLPEKINHEFTMLEQSIDAKQQYRGIIRAGISRWIKEFQEGKIVLSSVQDLRTMIQIDMELQKELQVDIAKKNRKRIIK